MKRIIYFLIVVIFLSVLPACNLSGWSTYTNTVYAFKLQYPSDGSLAPGDTSTYARIDLPITGGTNLAEKYLEINVSGGGGTCESPAADSYAPGSLTPTTLTINGLTWVREGSGEGAAGSIYQWTAYSTTHGSTCVSLTFVLHSHNPGSYSTPPPTFVESSESGVFETIVETFEWITPTPVPPASGWLTYTNQAYSFQLQYPSGGGGLQPGANAISARIDLPIAPGTTLNEKYLDIAVFTGTDDCSGAYSSGPAPEALTLNGLTWLKVEGAEGAAGNIYLWTNYATVSGIVCVRLAFVKHSNPPDLFPTPPPTYDEPAESAVFQQIVETFIWLGGAATTPTFVYTYTPTPVSLISFTPNINAFCRSGPDPIFSSISLAMKGEHYEIDGRTLENDWFLLRITPIVECWVPADTGEASGDTSLVRVMLDIATPTFTPLPGGQAVDCTKYTSQKACDAVKACTWKWLTDTKGYCLNR